MIGLVLLAVTLIAAEGGLDPRWLVPVMYIWVNSHGSFPLGSCSRSAAVARPTPRQARTAPPSGAASSGRRLGMARLGAEPVRAEAAPLPAVPPAAQRRASPHRRVAGADLHSTSGRSSSSSRSRRRSSCSSARAAAGASPCRSSCSCPAALYSARNILVASLVLTAPIAPCLKGRRRPQGRCAGCPRRCSRGRARSRSPRCRAAHADRPPSERRASTCARTRCGRLRTSTTRACSRPSDGSDGRLLAQDFVGNLREYLDGPVARRVRRRPRRGAQQADLGRLREPARG